MSRIGEADTLVAAVSDASSIQIDFSTFFEAEYVGLARYVWSLVGDKATAEDLASEAFVILFGRLVRVQQPRPYLYRVATNLARAHWRRELRERERVELVGASLAASETRDDLRREALRRAVLELPARYREVVLLHYFSGLSVAEVGNAVGRPAGTVKRLLFEARGRLAIDVEEP